MEITSKLNEVLRDVVRAREDTKEDKLRAKHRHDLHPPIDGVSLMP